MARLLRQYPQTGHSRLGKPVVVEQPGPNPPLEIFLFPVASARRKPVTHALSRPTVVASPAAAFIARPVATRLAATRRPSTARVVLIRPIVIYAAATQSALGWTAVSLAPQRRGVAKSALGRARVVGAASQVFAPIAGRLVPLQGAAEQHYRKTKASLGRPVVVGAEAVVAIFFGPTTTLSPRPRRTGAAMLFAPVVVLVAAEPNPPVALYLFPRGNDRRRAVSHVLMRPAVVQQPSGLVFYGPSTSLAPQTRQAGRAFLGAPVVVVVAVVYQPIRGVLFPLATTRRSPVAHLLRPPSVVAPPTTEVFFGPATTLAQRPRSLGAASLLPPTVVGAAEAVPPLDIYLFPLGTTRRNPVSKLLRAPSVVTQPTTEVFFGPAVTLAYSRRLRAKWGLAAPAVVFIAPAVLHPVAVTLAYQTRGKTRSRLQKPLVVGAIVYSGPIVSLAYSVRGAPRSELGTPKVVAGAPVVLHPIQTTFAYQSRRIARPELRAAVVVSAQPELNESLNVRLFSLVAARLRPVAHRLGLPAVVAGTAVFVGPLVSLAYSRRGVPESRLRPPLVVSAFIARPTVTSLADSRRGKPFSILRKPVVIDLRPQNYYLRVDLARIKPPPTLSFLRPSQVTEALPKAERDLRVTLTYSRRGTPKSGLRAPVVIDLRPQTRYLSVSLAYSRRGRPKSFLFEPVIPPLARPIEVTTVRLDLRRRRPTAELRAPAVVGRILFSGPTVTLAPQRRGTPKPDLRPPTVVIPPFVARPTVATLAYSLRGTPKSVLRLPVLAPPRFFGPTVFLAEPRRPVAKYGLAPPAVVGPGIYFRGIQTHLVRITPPPVEALLKPPTVVSTFHPPAGDVCGTDEPAADVCGSDSPESRIVGSDTAVGEACGTDEQST